MSSSALPIHVFVLDLSLVELGSKYKEDDPV